MTALNSFLLDLSDRFEVEDIILSHDNAAGHEVESPATCSEEPCPLPRLSHVGHCRWTSNPMAQKPSPSPRAPCRRTSIEPLPRVPRRRPSDSEMPLLCGFLGREDPQSVCDDTVFAASSMPTMPMDLDADVPIKLCRRPKASD